VSFPRGGGGGGGGGGLGGVHGGGFMLNLPKTKTLNLHSATFPVLSEAKYLMLCSPAGNVSPGCFPYCVMLGMKPELSVAVG